MDNNLQHRRVRKYQKKLIVLIALQWILYVILSTQLALEKSRWYFFGPLNLTISAYGLFAVKIHSIKRLKMYLMALLFLQIIPTFYIKSTTCKGTWWKRNHKLELYCITNLLLRPLTGIIFYLTLGYLRCSIDT